MNELHTDHEARPDSGADAIKSAKELVGMSTAEFNGYFDSVEDEFTDVENDLIEGQDINTIFDNRDMVEREVESKMNHFNLQDALGKDVQLTPGRNADRIREKAAEAVAARSAALHADVLYHDVRDAAQRQDLRDRAAEILLMPQDQFDELALKWAKLDEATKAEALRHQASQEAQRQAEQEELENPLFVKTQRELAAQQQRHQADLDQMASRLGARHGRNEESDTDLLPVVALGAGGKSGDMPQALRSRERAVQNGTELTVTMQNGASVTRRIERVDANGNLVVRESRVNEHGRTLPTETKTLTGEDALIFKDQLRQRPTDAKQTGELSLADYERQYGPFGMHTGDHFQIIDDKGRVIVASIDPLQQDGKGGYLPRTATFRTYDMSTDPPVEITGNPQFVTSNWEHFKEDKAHYDELNRHNHHYQGAYVTHIDHSAWKQAIQNRERAKANRELFDTIQAGDQMISSDNGMVHKVTGVENGIITIQVEGQEPVTLSAVESRHFAQGLAKRRELYKDIQLGDEFDYPNNQNGTLTYRVESVDPHTGVINVTVITADGQEPRALTIDQSRKFATQLKEARARAGKP